jgi:fermentation-respiration switch protein FrsA (DUF1100 family)
MTYRPSSPATATRRRPGSPARVAAALLLILVSGYGAALLFLVTQETRLVFQAGRPLSENRPSFPYEQIDVPRPDGQRQFAWVMAQPQAQTWVLFLHGNSATIASRVNIARYNGLRGLGLSVVAAEYRGFAGLPGTPSERSLGEDARAAYDYLTRTRGIAPARLVIYGWSLGSAVAVTLASQARSAAVILEGAPASLVSIGEQQYPFFPIRLVMRNPFESILRIDRIAAPLLFLHSPEDEIIPIGEGRRLFERASPPKRFVEVKGGHIYAHDADPAVFFGAIRSFLTEHRLLAPQSDP